MKEQIIKILKSHSYHHTEGVGVKSQFKYLAEIAFECCADEIMLALDQSQFTTDEAEELVNQEVEKRIAERMPRGDDAEIAQIAYERKQTDELSRFSYLHCYRDFMAGVEYCCSRLTCSEKPNNSQKTEGGAK